jgi:hypothetical protein
MVKAALLATILCACGNKADAPPSSGSSAPAAPAPPVKALPDVDCRAAANAYTAGMAASPGNILSDAKPDEGLIYFTSVSMSDYCDAGWTKEQRACLGGAAKTAAAVTACFSGAAADQVTAGLAEVVTSALANKKANEAAKAAGSGSAAP